MYWLETWLTAWWPTKVLCQTSWPLSFQVTWYSMFRYASKVMNADYCWRPLVFPFRFTAHSQTTLLSICFLLVALLVPHVSDSFWARLSLSTLSQKITLVLVATELTLMFMTHLSLLTHLLYFFSSLIPKDVLFCSYYISFWSDLGD